MHGETVWDIVQNKIPDLQTVVREMLDPA